MYRQAQIEADKLDGWVRLENNSLRPGAIAGMDSTSTKPTQRKQATKPTAPDVAPKPAPAPSTNTSQPASQESTPATTSNPFLPIDDSAPITLTWDGPMDVRPLTASPGELARNDVFARFTSEKDGGTTFTDEKTKAVATGALLEYGATRREVALASHEPMGATVTYPGGGTGQAQRFEMSMASGVIEIPTRGIISAESSGASSPIFAIGDTSPANTPADPNAAPVTRSLSWTDRADFQLIKNAQQEVTPVLSEVHANGNAKATDGQNFLSGESLIAQFKPVNPKASQLERLQVAGQARGGDGQGSTLTSDTLDVAFIANPDKPEQSDPSVVTAQGSVHAHSVDKKSGELNLSSSYLQTRLSRNIGGALEVTRLDASRSVAFDTTDGVHAKSEDLNVDPITHTAHLTGPPMTVEVTKDGTTITGQDMTLWNLERKLDSKGSGTLVHDGPIDAPGQLKTEGQTQATAAKSDPGHVEASWTREMTFDDAGTAVCLGDVNAVVTKPPHNKPSGEPIGLERDTVRADEVHLTFSPPPEDTKADPALGPPAPKPERRLLTIHAVGTPGDDPAKLAKVESRSYSVSPVGPAIDEQAVERILFLTGAEINLDNDKGTLDLPNPGKLLIVDTRAAAKPDKPKPDKSKPDKPNPDKTDANPFPFDTSSGLRGKTLFTWNGSMSMDRPTGVIHMNDQVVVMQNNDKDEQTKLECEKLTAYIREQQPDTATPEAPKPPSDSLQGELTSADAEGSVRLSSGTHEVTSNTLHYNALKKFATLTAAPDNIVTITDNKARTQLTSREKIEWDLANDRIEISKPGTIVAPIDSKKPPTTPKK